MDHTNWAKKIAPRKPKKDAYGNENSWKQAKYPSSKNYGQLSSSNINNNDDYDNKDEHVGTGSSMVAAASNTNVSSTTVKVKDIFTAPVRTAGNAHYLANKKVVLTGIFPELGGGTGLELGKAKMKALIESFGGQGKSFEINTSNE